MLFLGLDNYIFDPVDEVVEKADDKIIDILKTRGTLKKAITRDKDDDKIIDRLLVSGISKKVLTKDIVVRRRDVDGEHYIVEKDFKKFLDKKLAKTKLLKTGFGTSLYDIEVNESKNGNFLNIDNINLKSSKSDNIIMDIPSYLNSTKVKVKDISVATYAEFNSLKITRKRFLADTLQFSTDTLTLECLQGNDLDLTDCEYSKVNIYDCFLKSVKLGSGLSSFMRLFANSVVDYADFSLVDFKKIKNIDEMFSYTYYESSIDLSKLNPIDTAHTFFYGQIKGNVKLGKLSSYKKMFSSGSVLGTVYLKDLDLSDLDISCFDDMFLYARIQTLDMRGTSANYIAFNCADIETLYLSQESVYIIDKEDVTFNAVIGNLVFSNVKKPSGCNGYRRSGFLSMSNLEKITFEDCSEEFILDTVGYITGIRFGKTLADKIIIGGKASVSDKEKMIDRIKQFLIEENEEYVGKIVSMYAREKVISGLEVEKLYYSDKNNEVKSAISKTLSEEVNKLVTYE